MNDHDHFGRIAHLPTTPKRSVLEALAGCGPMDRAAVVLCWRDRSPALRPLVSQSLARMVSHGVTHICPTGGQLIPRWPSSAIRSPGWTVTRCG